MRVEKDVKRGGVVVLPREESEGQVVSVGWGPFSQSHKSISVVTSSTKTTLSFWGVRTQEVKKVKYLLRVLLAVIG